MTGEPAIRKNPHVVFRKLAGENGGVLLHAGSGQYHGLNAVGSLIWDLIDGERGLDHLIVELREQVDDPPANLREEAERFLAELRERDLIAS
jgi:hypothetical protein